MLRVTRRCLYFWGTDLQAHVKDVRRGHFIDNEFLPTPKSFNSGVRCLLASSPSDELPVAVVADIGGQAAVVDKAVAAADAATKRGAAWGRDGATCAERADILLKLATALETRSDEIATVEALCSGMCLADARFSVRSSVDVFRRFAAVAMLPAGSVLPPFTSAGAHATAITRREPVGVVGLITPFNFALEMGAWKIAPALAAGNAVVWKAPEQAPLSAQILAECAAAAGVPPGVVNVVHGDREAGEALVKHPRVGLIGFTGSTAAGAQIQVLAAQSGVKRCNLELGGNAPLLVCDDFDMEAAARISMACFSNNGQSCTSTRRIYVPARRLKEFLMALQPLVEKRKLGHALDPEVEQGPMISGTALARVIAAVQRAERQGASLVCGGYRATFTAGYFMAPTVVTHIAPTDPLVAQELFGPVMVVRTYETLDAAFEEIDASSYGLSANVLTRDIDLAQQASERLPAGTVWINGADIMNATTPFGGIRSSGYGKDLGTASLDGYSNAKTIITVRST